MKEELQPFVFKEATSDEVASLLPGRQRQKGGLAAGGPLVIVAMQGAEMLAGALIDPLFEKGGSSLATRRYKLTNLRLCTQVASSLETAALGEAIAAFLSLGGRIAQLEGDIDESPQLLELGFTRNGSVLKGNRESALKAVQGLVTSGKGVDMAEATRWNLEGRLLHDAGLLEEAVGTYMRAVQADPSRGEVFRNLGGAYQSLGQHSMAFASFQQAISVNQEDYVAYLKLGMLYEELASIKYTEATDHAIKCYAHYLDQSGEEDTDVLTRLGNLQIAALSPQDAVETYARALVVDPSLANVWFNKANAHLKLIQQEEAKECLKRVLELEPSSPTSSSARYLLAALTGDASALNEGDRVAHAAELFDYYADTYDDHRRQKLLYTAPRLLRSAVREAFTLTGLHLAEKPLSPADPNTPDILAQLNKTLEVLDLGCGTGLCGSWFADYSSRLVGVDISQRMLDQASRKGMYDLLKRAEMKTFLDGGAAASKGGYDVVVCGDALPYVGTIGPVVQSVSQVLRPGGLFAFTAEALDSDDSNPESNGGCLQSTHGTFAHSEDHIRQAASSAGLQVVQLSRTSSRLERGDPLPGWLAVLRRPPRISSAATV